ncbi:tyrosine-protein phosphatase [Bdellovibrio sp. NC01]|uniref:phosphatase domain-containing protein n=1 Tax=Bdellovibrio sp. NC01 TaxID=2220073 RepID=UPI0011579F92|nr:tyrosine-protein phosphatase [Bdellovibrio sp. NC01]QDK37095.1 protein tyrosine phosphatase [Bdellovibrio sp. NC01]
MKKTALILPLLLLACAEKKVQTSSADNATSLKNTVAKTSFMSKPQPTEPVEPVFDEKYEGSKLVNYRKNDALHMSGSSMFNPKNVKELAKPAKKMKAPLYIFDLRQESHGFINDKPVTWQAPNDWANADLTHTEVLQRERRLLLDTGIGTKFAGQTVQSIETEESVVRSRGYEYVRLTVTDHLRPDDGEVDRFIEAVRALPEKNWVHFHCRAGKGRTTTFMVMYDMLRNAKTDSLEDIVNRNAKLSDEYDVLDVPAQDNWKYQYQKERAQFIRDFYNYAKAHPNGSDVLWTDWTK